MNFTLAEVRAVVREELARALGEQGDAPEVLTRVQVAELLDVEEHTVTRYVREKGLPGVQLGRSWRFRRSEVLRWMAEQGGRR